MHATYLCQEWKEKGYNPFMDECWLVIELFKESDHGLNEAREKAEAWWEGNKGPNKRVIVHFDPVPPDRVIKEWEEKE